MRPDSVFSRGRLRVCCYSFIVTLLKLFFVKEFLMNRIRRQSEPILPFENRKKANSVNIDLSPLVPESPKKVTL